MTLTTSPAASRPLPKSYLSAEKREDLLREVDMDFVYICESQEARRANDMKSSWAWMALAAIPAHTLMFLKNSRGAQFIREFGFNTINADEKYGPGWLDRD